MGKRESQQGGDSTEQKIFDAAHEVFTQKGMDGAKMQEIADRAGINKALLHYYYRTKEKLYEAVARAIIQTAVPRVRGVLESELSLEEKLTQFVHLYVDLILKNPYIPLFIVSETNKHPDHFFDKILPKELPKPELIFRQIESEIAAGRIRPVDPRHLIINVVSMCVFPFLARPIARLILGLSAEEMRAMLESRKHEIVTFVMASLRP